MKLITSLKNAPTVVASLSKEQFMETYIRIENKLVPLKYYFYSGSRHPRISDHVEDVNASLPRISYTGDYWMLEFDSAEFGGYDVCSFHYLYDSLDDLLHDLGI